MATLTETAYWTRKILKFGTIALVAFIVLRTTFKIGSNIWRQLHPPPPPPPTVSFGKLPKLVFPEENLPIEKTKISFKLETIAGGLPKLPEIGKVYFIPVKGPNLLALDRANTLARKMGFRSEPEKITETVYRWLSENSTVLEMEINNLNFHLIYDFRNDPEILTSKNLPTNQQAAQEAKNFLVSNGLLAEDLANGTAEFEYLRFSTPELIPVSSLSEADFIRVNLFRANLDDLRILPPNPKKSLISFLFSGSRTPGKRIIEINYTYFPLEKEIFATYPLKPITQAWGELQQGQGFIANLGQNENGQVTIRKVYLAYYDSETLQHYLQPIYVFEGDRNFWGYVPAIDPKWTE
ncbi:MAG: hypothetical protein ACPLXP_00660 [Microgenomates group bacterium]